LPSETIENNCRKKKVVSSAKATPSESQPARPTAITGSSDIRIPAYGGGNANRDNPTSEIASVSLKAMQANVMQPVVQPVKVSDPAPSAYESAMQEMNTPVTADQIKHTWIRYAKSVADEKPRLYSMMSNQVPELRNGTELWLKLKNQTQETEIQREKGGILKFMREELRNSHLIINVEMEKEDTPTNIAYTASDKFKLMLDKNPKLLKLKQQFGLDIE
jgi:DNA polymerase-3 subunit gamma/tau